MRLPTACDSCKARKVKCDGSEPCNHCKRRKKETCTYSHSVKRPRLETAEPLQQVAKASGESRPIQLVDTHVLREQRPTSIIDEEEDTLVPHDSRLLQDAQGKFMFVGDCAPLSFLQSVRHLVTAFVNTDAFASSHGGHDALLEQSDNAVVIEPLSSVDAIDPPAYTLLRPAVSTFSAATSGLLDIGDAAQLQHQLERWSNLDREPQYILSAVNYLILAIGLQSSHESLARTYFNRARSLALAHLTFDTSPLTVQSFLLIAIYMLRSCQPNGAFLYFSLAARASYSIGMHRTEVNARFGVVSQRERERLYKSLKVVDLFISIGLGRPPALYDLDCTVAYEVSLSTVDSQTDILDDILQILLIVETIVEQVYGDRRKISLQQTKQISQRLKDWANVRAQRLESLLTIEGRHSDIPSASGACQALSTYYYAIMLLSRPFLMFEAYRFQTQQHVASSHPAKQGRRTLAEGCIDAACRLVEMVGDLTRDKSLPLRMPLVVSWLFTSSLALGVALVGGFGRIMETYLADSIAALEYFSAEDPQAMQYSIIAKTLLSTALGHINQKEMDERAAKGKASADLFGLPVTTYRKTDAARHGDLHDQSANQAGTSGVPNDLIAGDASTSFTPNWEDFDLGIFGDLSADISQDFFGTLNLFPMSDTTFE